MFSKPIVKYEHNTYFNYVALVADVKRVSSLSDDKRVRVASLCLVLEGTRTVRRAVNKIITQYGLRCAGRALT